MKIKDTILGGKYWRWVVTILMILLFIFGASQCKSQCTTSTDTVYGGTCTMYPIVPVPAGQTATRCFIFKPETEIIHLDYLLAQGQGCGPFQYSSLQAYIYDLNCNLEHYANIHPTQTDLDAVLDTTQWYYLCLRFTASCTLTAACPQYNLSYLPVTLEYFTAEVEEASVKIEWMSSSERNSNYYEIHRADSNMVFLEIYRRYTPVFSTIKRYYAYTDEIPPDGVLYYKLVQVDIDGCVTEYPPVSVEVRRKYRINPFDFYDIMGRQLKKHEEN